MLIRRMTTQGGSASSRRLQSASLLVLLCLVLPVTAWASPGPADAEPCAQCHPAEAAAWQDSPHAQALVNIDAELKATGDQSACLSCHTTGLDDTGVYDHAGVTCEACHGLYEPNHPGSGTMRLSVDSSPCQNCHAATYEEWTKTVHAQSGVQCIGCHQAHTQQTRQSDDALCGSCHRERLHDFEHTAHENANVACADCHLPAAAAFDTNVGLGLGGSRNAPAHSFAVASQTCSGCHATSIHIKAPGEVLNQTDETRLAATSERVRELAYELEDVKQDNRSLQTVALVSLGLGLGVGGMLGIIFVAVVGLLNQRKAES
jgi:hypothetical protein